MSEWEVNKRVKIPPDWLMLYFKDSKSSAETIPAYMYAYLFNLSVGLPLLLCVVISSP